MDWKLLKMKNKINIIYEDNHVLVVEKPINIGVQEDSSNDEDLLNILKGYLKEKYNKPGNVYLGLVHRLDRPVGGIMVFAKTSKAAARLSKSFNEHSIVKKYFAKSFYKRTPQIFSVTIEPSLICQRTDLLNFDYRPHIEYTGTWRKVQNCGN